ncbi:hypothetical protein Avbf_19165, partial [Armadillidium vulgare]
MKTSVKETLDSRVSFTLFDELKDFTNQKDFGPFICVSRNEEMSSQMVHFKMFDKYRANQFIKLCTGEYGPSYQGSHFVRGSENNERKTIIFVEKYNSETKSSIEYKDFAEEAQLKEMESYNPNPNDMFLRVRHNGGFEITRIFKSCSYASICHGKVTYPTNLYNCLSYTYPSHMKILDC